MIENKELIAALGDLETFINEQKGAFIDMIGALAGSVRELEWKTSRETAVLRTPEGVLTQIESKEAQ